VIKILISIFIFLFMALSQASDYISGQGRFYAADGDSIQFIKKQLLYNAFRNVINKDLKHQGLNDKRFWEIFDHKFEESFAEIKETLQTKYNIVEGEKIDPKVQEKYKKALRAKRLVLRTKFSSLVRAISSYAIKTITRSPKYPKSRFLSLQAKVDRKILNRIYFRFIKSGENKKFSSLIISPTLSLTNLTWDELGVEVKNDLTEVIYGHWKKWYQDNLGEFFGAVKVIEGDLIGEVTREDDEPALEERSDEELEEEAPVIYGASLVLKVTISLTKVEERLLLKKRKISISGDGILINQKTKQVIGHFELPRQSHFFSTEKAEELGSNMASWIYRSPLMEFGKLKKHLASNLTSSKVAHLKVVGISSVSDLFTLNKILEEKGVANQVISKTKTYNGNEAMVLIYFQGSFDQIEQIVKGVNTLNIKDNKILNLSLMGV